MPNYYKAVKQRLSGCLKPNHKKTLENKGYNRRSIDYYLNVVSERKPPATFISAVSVITGISCDYLLLGIGGENEYSDEEEKILLRYWHRLTDADRAAFLRMLDRVAHKEEIIQSLGGSAPPKAARAGGG